MLRDFLVMCRLGIRLTFCFVPVAFSSVPYFYIAFVYFHMWICLYLLPNYLAGCVNKIAISLTGPVAT